MVALRDVFSVHRTNQGDAAALQGATLTVRRGESVCVLGQRRAEHSPTGHRGLQTPSAAVQVLGATAGPASRREPHPPRVDRAAGALVLAVP
jgi:hypothetical protein